MVDLDALSAATPGTVSEIAARLGATEREVRRVIQGIRDRSPARRQDIKIIGRRGGRNIYKIGPPPPKVRPKRVRTRPDPTARPPQLWSPPEAAEATFKQAREVMAERVTRDCMRCKTKISTTRHGPRFCDNCRRYITGLG